MSEDDVELEKTAKEPGAPRWAVALAAIVSAVTVTWGIAKFFIERSSESPHTKVVTAPVRSASAPTVSVSVNQSASGNQNLIINRSDHLTTINMNGSTQQAQSASAPPGGKP